MRYLYFVKIAPELRYVEGGHFNTVRPVEVLGAFASRDAARNYINQIPVPAFLRIFEEFDIQRGLTLVSRYGYSRLSLKDLVRFCRRSGLPDLTTELTTAIRTPLERQWEEIQEALQSWWVQANPAMSPEQRQEFWQILGCHPYEIVEVEVG